MFLHLQTQNGDIAQLARASALQAEGRRFDSVYLHKLRNRFTITVSLFFCFVPA